MNNILEENYRIPYSVYQGFYKELGVENVLGAIKIVGIKKDFQTAFKKSDAYAKYLIDREQEIEYEKENKPIFGKSKIEHLYNLEDGKVLYERLCNGNSQFDLSIEFDVDKSVISRYVTNYLEPNFGKVIKLRKISMRLINNKDDIRDMLKKGFTHLEILEKYKVARSTLSNFISYHKLNQ